VTDEEVEVLPIKGEGVIKVPSPRVGEGQDEGAFMIIPLTRERTQLG